MKKFLFTAVVVCLFAAPALAQDEPRSWIDVNLGVATSAQGDVATSFGGILFGEPAALAAAYGQPSRGADFDFGGGHMFTSVLGAAVSISGTAHVDDTAGLAVSIPHPYFFNSSASDASVTEPALKRGEGALHMQLVAMPLPAGGSVQLRLFGGPSYFRVKQDLVADIGFLQVATPFSRSNVVAIDNWERAETEGSAWGFHAGADVGFFFSRVVGVGGMIRFSRATVALFDPLSEQDVEFKAGGVQAGGGLRLRF
jgi:hypothetical protein